jgi:hypothetical protein
MPEHVHQPIPKLPDFTPTSRKTPTPSATKKGPPVPSKPAMYHSTPVAPPGVAPLKRRLDKVTPSSYTFASDSTKLGEIPQSKWTTPFDYEEAERLNKMAVATPIAAPGGGEEKTKVKKGMRFWKRGETA